MEIYIS